jgi:hypothetical protein
MADKAASVEVVTSKDDIPGGAVPFEGESPEEAMEGLYEALGSDDEEEFEDPESEDSPTGDDEDEESDDDAGSEESDEDEESEDEDEDESEDDGDDAEEDGEELSDDIVVKGVPLPGGETTEVTLKELKAGYSRQADYTRKTQKLAAEHGEVMAETREVRDQYKAKLGQVEEILSRMGPQKPDPALRQENPGEYAAQLAEHQAFQDSLAAISSATGAVTEEEQVEFLQAQQAHVEREWSKLVQAVPEWADQATATQELTALRQFAIESYGFTPEEIDSVADSRLLLMLRQNHALKQQQTEVEKKVETKKAKAKERLKPGGRKTTSTKSRRLKALRAADKRAQSTGRVQDAADAILLALGDDD